MWRGINLMLVLDVSFFFFFLNFFFMIGSNYDPIASSFFCPQMWLQQFSPEVMFDHLFKKNRQLTHPKKPQIWSLLEPLKQAQFNIICAHTLSLWLIILLHMLQMVLGFAAATFWLWSATWWRYNVSLQSRCIKRLRVNRRVAHGWLF